MLCYAQTHTHTRSTHWTMIPQILCSIGNRNKFLVRNSIENWMLRQILSELNFNELHYGTPKRNAVSVVITMLLIIVIVIIIFFLLIWFAREWNWMGICVAVLYGCTCTVHCTHRTNEWLFICVYGLLGALASLRSSELCEIHFTLYC